MVSNDGDVVGMCACSGPGLKVCSEFRNSGRQAILIRRLQEQLSNINLDALMDAAKTGRVAHL